MLVVLDDDVSRLEQFAALATALGDRWPMRRWQSAGQMLTDIATAIGEARLVSLDHDLERAPPGPPDPGCGRDIADWLALRQPSCPVIVHSSNTDAAWGMINVLRRAGWTVELIQQMNEPGWIAGKWLPVARRLVAVHAPSARTDAAAPDWLWTALASPSADRYAALEAELRAWPAPDCARALFAIALRHDGSGADYRAAALLMELEPELPLDCEAALSAVERSTLDVDAQELAFYLASQFGRPRLGAALRERYGQGGAARPPAPIDALAYWVRQPQSRLRRGWDWRSAGPGAGPAGAN